MKLTYLQECMMRHNRRLIFVIGGAYGFSDDVYQRADFKLSLSIQTSDFPKDGVFSINKRKLFLSLLKLR